MASTSPRENCEPHRGTMFPALLSTIVVFSAAVADALIAAVQAVLGGGTIVDTFNYTVSDGHGGTAMATVTL